MRISTAMAVFIYLLIPAICWGDTTRRRVTISSDCSMETNIGEGVWFGEGYKLEINKKREHSPVTPLFLNMMCLRSDDDQVGSGVKFDSKNQSYKIDFENFFYKDDEQKAWNLRWFTRNYTITQLHPKGGSGYVIIDRTQTNFGTIPNDGDKESQAEGPIYLSFCLIKAPRAICGNGDMGLKQRRSDKYLTIEALKILRSLNFPDH